MTDQRPNSTSGPGLSKNLAFIAVFVLLGLGIVGVLLLHLFRPDASATFIQTIVTFAGILTTTITLLYGLGKVNERIEVVQRQTNGTLSKLMEENTRKEDVIQRLHGEKVELAKQVPPSP